MDRMKPKSPKEAKSFGLKTYFTGVACKRGKVAYRRLNGDCLCNKCTEFTKQLKIVWAKKNADKNKAWRDQNPEKMRMYRKKWEEKNKELVLKNQKKWKTENKDKILGYTRKRQLKIKNAVPKWYGEFDDFVMQEAAKLCYRRNLLTGIKWSVDHLIPILSKTACGLHVADNLQVIPSKLNFSKINKMIFTERNDWIGAL
jgi:hypothetical protein